MQPSGSRTFGRVIPSDAAQGAAAAESMKRAGIETVAVVGSGDTYRGSLLDGFESVSGGPSLLSAAGSADAVYVASSRPERDLPRRRRFGRLRRRRTDLRPRRCEPGCPPAPASSPGADAPPQAAAGFRAAKARPGRFAAYGYEAMAVVLDSIDRADDPLDRSSVIDSFFATTDRDSILGSYSIDDVGDTTLSRVGAFVARPDGGLEAEPEPLTAP